MSCKVGTRHSRPGLYRQSDIVDSYLRPLQNVDNEPEIGWYCHSWAIENFNANDGRIKPVAVQVLRYWLLLVLPPSPLKDRSINRQH